jgi:hypothetical protein
MSSCVKGCICRPVLQVCICRPVLQVCICRPVLQGCMCRPVLQGCICLLVSHHTQYPMKCFCTSAFRKAAALALLLVGSLNLHVCIGEPKWGSSKLPVNKSKQSVSLNNTVE